MKKRSKNFQLTIIIIFILAVCFFLLQSSSKTRQLLLPAVQRAEADTLGVFTVNSTLDERDASPLDGVCLSTPSGLCTLRAAITQAGFNSVPDTIILQENETYSLTLPGVEDSNLGGDLDLHSDLTIEVANNGKATIDGNDPVLDDAVIQVFQGSVTLIGLVIKNGGQGGIRNASDLTLQDVTIKNNYGSSCSSPGNGGITNNGNLEMYQSTVASNFGYNGGGINNTGTFLAVNSTISGNLAYKSGGGIFNDDNGPGFPGSMTLRNTTVTSNFAAVCSSAGGGGGVSNASTELVDLANTIIANNHRGLISPTDNDCAGYFHSLGYNLVRIITGCRFQGISNGNIFGADPKLGPLQNNDGLTATHALLGGSPAIDAGDIAGCKDESGFPLSFDQRGVTRHLDGGSGISRCDLGAFEYSGIVPPPPAGSSFVFIPFLNR